MILHQAASFSSDSFINGISILFIAYAISCIYEKDTFSWRDFTVLLMSGMLLAPAKIVYIPIVFLIFLVAWRWKAAIKAKAWILACAVIAASLTMVMIFSGANVVGTATEAQLNWEGGYNYTLSFIFENPLKTAEIYLRSLYHFREWIFFSMFGRYLSGFTLILPLWYITVMVAFLVAGVIYGKKEEWHPSISNKAVIALICAAVVVSNFTAMFLTWTSDWHTLILGIQGRYFIPILPLALLLLKNKYTLISSRVFYNAVVCGFVMMQCAVIIYILNHTIDKF